MDSYYEMAPYKHNFGQKITSDVEDINADRGFIAHLNFIEPAAQSIAAILPATALTDAVQEITEGITDPDVPRNVKIKGNAAGVVGNVIVTGKNIAGEDITETIATNGTTEVQGNKAFKTFTSITLPAETHAGTDTISVGTGNKLGLPYLLEHDTVLKAYRNNAKESTAPTVACDSDDIESNTILLNSALNGTDVDVYLIV